MHNAPLPPTTMRLNHDDRRAIVKLQKLTGLTNMIAVIRLALRESIDARVKGA